MEDPYSIIDEEAGDIPEDQVAILESAPFLNSSPDRCVNTDPVVPTPMSPADEPIMICSLPQTSDANQATTAENSANLEKKRSFSDMMESLSIFVDSAKKSMKHVDEIDILEVFRRKGVRIDPPSWHRPGGYGDKNEDLDHGNSRQNVC